MGQARNGTGAWLRDFVTFCSYRFLFFGANEYERKKVFEKWDAQPYPKWLNGMFFKDAKELDRVMKLKEMGCTTITDADPNYRPDAKLFELPQNHTEERSVDPDFFDDQTFGEEQIEDETVPKEDEEDPEEEEREDIAA